MIPHLRYFIVVIYHESDLIKAMFAKYSILKQNFRNLYVLTGICIFKFYFIWHEQRSLFVLYILFHFNFLLF